MSQGLSHCAAKYAVAISDPWSPEADGACIPRAPSRPSQKIKLFNRVNVTISSNGYTPIYFMPCFANDCPVMVVGPTSASPISGATVYNNNVPGATAGSATVQFVSGSTTITLSSVTNAVGIGSTFTSSFITGTATILAAIGTPNNGGAGSYTISVSANSSGTSTLSFSNPTTTINTSVKPNSPYASSQFLETAQGGAAVQGRLVSFGASIQYTGTVLQMGGIYYSYSSPNHENLNNSLYSTDRIGAQDETFVERITAKKQWFAMSSIDDVETSYSGPASSLLVNNSLTGTNSVYPYSQGYLLENSFGLYNPTSFSAVAPGGAPMVMIVNSVGIPAGSSVSFEVELVQHVEFIGTATAALHTPTHSDARGFEIVQNAQARLPQLRVTDPNRSLPSLMTQALGTVIREVAPVVMPGLMRSGVAALAGYAANRMMEPRLARLKLM